MNFGGGSFPGSSLPDAPGPDASRKDPNYVKEAFNIQYNWIALAGAAAFALVTGTAVPLALAGGLELMYLAVVSQHPRFQRLVRSWKFAEEQKQNERKLTDMLRSLPTCRAATSGWPRFAAPSAPITASFPRPRRSLFSRWIPGWKACSMVTRACSAPLSSSASTSRPPTPTRSKRKSRRSSSTYRP